jgi:TMEM175 potassium channel family protein
LRPANVLPGKRVRSPIWLFLYLIAISLAFVNARTSAGLYVFVGLLWLIPDPRIERKLEKREH